MFSKISDVFFCITGCTKVESGGYDIEFQTNSSILWEYWKGKIAVFQCNIEIVLKCCTMIIYNNEKVVQMQYFTEKSIATLQMVQD